MELLSFFVCSVAAGVGLYLSGRRPFARGNSAGGGRRTGGRVATQKQFTAALVQVLTASTVLGPATLEVRAGAVLREQGLRFAPGSYFRQRLARLVRSGRLLKLRKGRGHVYFLPHDRFNLLDRQERQVAADFLEDNGEVDRAEFLRGLP
jgi:hypothetical protein